jgi:hypothetical protein
MMHRRGIYELRSEAKQRHTGLSTQISQSFDRFKQGEAQILGSITSASITSTNVVKESEARLHGDIWPIGRRIQRLLQAEAASSKTQSEMYTTVQEMADFLPSSHLMIERKIELLRKEVTLPIQQLYDQLSAHRTISDKKLDLLLESATGRHNQQSRFEMSVPAPNTKATIGDRQQNEFEMSMSVATPIWVTY